MVGAIEDPKVVREVMEGVDAVVNFAAESHVDRSIADQEAFARTHVIGTGVLLDAARERGVTRYLQVSTDEVYGSIASGSFTEESPLDPSSPYSATKAAGDLLVSAHAHTYGIEAVICRGSNNYGPRQYPEKLIPLMILNALHGDSLPVYGDGRQVRNWLYVEDFCRGIHAVLERGRPGQAYNVGGPDECENIEVVTRILELTGADESLIEHVTDRPGHDRRYSLAVGEAARRAGLGGRRCASRRACAARSTGIATTSPGGGRSARASTASTTSASTGGRWAECREPPGVRRPGGEAARRGLPQARHAPPAALVHEALAPAPGERILDVGCGPGFYVAELLDAVGPEGSVVGVDGSSSSLAVAARRCEGRANVAFHEADATSLPVADAEFDAALSVQVLEYVPDVAAVLRRDPPGAPARRAGGGLGRGLVHGVHAHRGPGAHGPGAGRWDSHLTHTTLPRTLGSELRAAGFDQVRMEGHTFATDELVA